MRSARLVDTAARGDARPVVGISTYREPADWGAWRQVRADLLPAAYADCVTAAGGVPVLLPPNLDADAALAVCARLDALVIGGGADVDPARYGASPETHTTAWRADRDASEMALLDAAAEIGRAADGGDLPTLGICRGMQVMAIRVGGALQQHLPDVVGHQGHSPGDGVYGPTTVRMAPGSRIAAILGDEVIVPCHHHQSVTAHPGFAASAAALDGTLEAMEDAARPFHLAVQWHPEAGDDLRLFAALVAAARERP